MRSLRGALLAGACAIIMVSGGALAQQQEQMPPQPGGAGEQQSVQQQQPGMGEQPAAQEQATGQGAATSLSSEDVRRIQERLSEAGHDVTVDGIWGPETQSALREFQQEQGLEATGNPDQETLAALGVSGGEGEQMMPTGGQGGAGGGAGQEGVGAGQGGQQPAQGQSQ